MRETETGSREPEEEPFVRVPGLHRSWEIQQLLEPGCELRIEEAGEAGDGTPLFAVYRKDQGESMDPSR